MIPEKPGIYWIKTKNGNYFPLTKPSPLSGWIVGQYSDYGWLKCWESIGNEESWSDDQVVQIGPEIVPPER